MREKIETTNIKMCNEIKKVVKETNVETDMSYARVAARNVLMADVSKNVPLLIRPKEKQSIEKTKAELNKKVDPINFKVPKQVAMQIIITDMDFKLPEKDLIDKLKK